METLTKFFLFRCDDCRMDNWQRGRQGWAGVVGLGGIDEQGQLRWLPYTRVRSKGDRPWGRAEDWFLAENDAREGISPGPPVVSKIDGKCSHGHHLQAGPERVARLIANSQDDTIYLSSS